MSVESLSRRRPDPLGEALRALPPQAPPIDAWPRLAASLQRRHHARRARRMALAASVAMLGVLIGVSAPRWFTPPVVAPTLSTAPERLDALPALQAESAHLEAMLAWLEPGLRGADALAIDIQLVDRLQWIDRLLADPLASDGTHEVLWRQRVDLLGQRVALSQDESLLAVAAFANAGATL